MFVGMTIHAWGAVALNSSNVGTLISYIKTCKPALQRWKNTQVLVIDESMNSTFPYFYFADLRRVMI
jgi:hypothetical protein